VGNIVLICVVHETKLHMQKIRRPLGRPRRRWVDNIKMDLRDGIGWIGLNWLRIGTSGGLF
jgi:hypothetical protein